VLLVTVKQHHARADGQGIGRPRGYALCARVSKQRKALGAIMLSSVFLVIVLAHGLISIILSSGYGIASALLRVRG
jgi:hypothetical protein